MPEGTEGAGGGDNGNVGGTGGDNNLGGTGGGTQQVDLMTMLPEEIRGVPSITKFTKEGKLDLGNLAKSYIEIERAYGKKANAFNIPTDKSTPEERAAFYKAMGVPESSDKYGLEAPKDLPEGMAYNPELTKMFSDVAHKLGISTVQLKGLHDAWNTAAIAEHKESMESAEKFRVDSIANMKKEWGPDYDTNLAKSDAIIVKVFGEDFQKMIKETGLANHPSIIKGMYRASQAVGEHSFATGDGGGWKGEVPNQQKLQDMIKDPLYAQRNYDHMKKVEAYAKELTDYNESKGIFHKTSNIARGI